MKSGVLPISDHTDRGILLLEEERRRIARDLHDGPAQALTNLSMRLGVLRNVIANHPDRALTELDKVNGRLVEAINEIRRLIYDLRPVAIDEAGLINAVRELASKCQNDWKLPVLVHVDQQVTDEMAPAKQVAIYRLIQEVFNNIHKHAQASEVRVSVTCQEQHLRVEIRDDGKGFDPNCIPEGHYGIVGMRERAAYLGGCLEIESSPGNGTTFVIVVPVSGTAVSQ
ncbi:hypothetical protein GCM10025857_26760 [Alicyclobacillus contaminans]|uniref:sensor histidine kinase n=1 Tax=Alicyclobacillus contaminans TaxID=392016 RepID=UPI000419DFD3|nr:sensor histidine kinase [Alicyclobacillus contaminans]GMA51319.1 hypothetical protein GCM10025857_26760 [Alicyclobacillus contaminans]